MKKLTITIFLIIFLIDPAYGFAGMTADNSTTQPDLNNTTESDQDIVLRQHLIELDAVQMQSENRLLIRETLLFMNQGAKNFSGFLRTWVPDGSEGIRVGKIEMIVGAMPVILPHEQKGNIISWKEQNPIKPNDPLPPLYVVEYALPAEPEGTLTSTKHYSKVLLFPTLTKQPVSIVLKVTRNQGETVAVTDEEGSSISASGNPRDEDNSVLYGWEMPEFKRINIEISRPAATPAGIAGYLILGLVILLVLSYPVIRKRSGKIKAVEEKIRSSLKREETDEEAEEDISEAASEDEYTELEGKTRGELESLKNEILSKLSELDKEYESCDLLDEEYEAIRKSYQEKVEKIDKRLH